MDVEVVVVVVVVVQDVSVAKVVAKLVAAAARG